MKSGCYFTLKDFFFLKILKFLSRLSGHVEKRLDQKDTVNSKIYDVTNWEANNCNHILPNISRIKGNQQLKFDQLIEYNIKSTFTKCGRKAISGPCSKKSKFCISLDQWSKILYSLFLLYAKLRDHLHLPHLNLFQKTKRALKLISRPYFQENF